ncbi:hypothetical protein NP493_138g01023 [Ridgeia piscesae]|uniref:Axonemal 84 kDa protein n=1 Tax=Ridgeia piscesae TaxID=27915 RepID=A0AAD9UG72_RIDPI|nr:hypothetical protein NP493_138g01023 [Ridgeia piscesae]
MNLQKVMGDGATTLCMWGNLSKNPRIKSHEFSEVNFTFEMPKLLTLSDCSIRVMFCKYDHYSSRCKSFLPRVKPKAVPIIEAPTEVIVEDVDGEKVEGEEEVQDGTASRASKIDDVGSVHKEEDPTTECQDIHTALQGMESGEEIEGEQEEGKEEEEVEKESIDENPSPEPDQYEDFDGDIDALDMRANHVLGGIFHFNLFHLPPQPKFVKNWLITQVIEPCELSYMDYKVEPVILHTPSNAESKSLADGEEGENHEEGEEKDKEKEKVESVPKKEPTREMSAKDSDKKDTQGAQEKKDLEKTAIGVVMKLPDTVYFCEDPQVCRWNEQLQQWQVDGFNDRVYNEENRTLSFKTNYFGTMALVQDAHINMPFQSWELRPRATNCTILTVIAAIIEVEIEIKDNLCCLRQPNKPELEHLIEHYMRPKQFIKKMAAAGLNIFPSVDSSKYVSIQEKSVIVEDDVYRQMAITASMMAYSWSKWNSGVKNKKPIIIQGAEHLKDEHLLEEDWGLFMVTKKRSIKLKMTEFDETFGDEHAPGTQFHASLYHLTKAMASDKGKERLEDTKFPFVDTVYTLLKAVRPLTYS